MRYKPERALTPNQLLEVFRVSISVEMRYKPERALTPEAAQAFTTPVSS